MVLLPPGDRPVEVLLHSVCPAETSSGVREGAHGQQGSITELRLLDGERDSGLRDRGSSTPTTMGPGKYPAADRQCPRTTTTRPCAWSATCELADPSSDPETPPLPREPTTTIWALALCSQST
jgi:hypothetical protein